MELDEALKTAAEYQGIIGSLEPSGRTEQAMLVLAAEVRRLQGLATEEAPKAKEG